MMLWMVGEHSDTRILNHPVPSFFLGVLERGGWRWVVIGGSFWVILDTITPARGISPE